MGSRSPNRIILNVDDDEAGRYAVSRLLKQANYEVIEAATGIEGLKLAAEHSPDLILLDVRLPDIDGFEVCRRLKADVETRTIPVVHMSASYLDSTYQARGLEGGADGYLLEPVDPSVLIASVNSMMRIRDAEREVRKYAKAWQSTFDSIQDGIAVLDSEGNILQSNARFCRLFPAGGFGKVSPASLRDSIREVETARQQIKWEMVQGDSSLAVSLDPIQAGPGSQGAVCIVRDVTERNRIEENLRFTQKLESVGLLAGGIAHDFNNLLTGVLGNASLALDAPDLPDRLRPMLQQVILSSERAADLTRQLLAYAGKGSFFEGPVDCSEMVRETLSLVRTSLVKVQIKLNLDSFLPKVQADATQLRQLLMNLIINASEAVEKTGGWIAITTRKVEFGAKEAKELFPKHSLQPGKYVSLEVQDSGIGMAADTMERIFDPFFTTKFVGRGLGLSAALGIVQSHRGAIRVSSALGKGSYFQVVMPVAAIVEKTEATQQPAPGKRAGTILIIDDEEAVRGMMKLALQADGHSVLLAANGREGINQFRGSSSTIDLVIVDLTMPVMSGEETIRSILSLSPTARIAVCTGHSRSEADELIGVGIVGVIPKPFRGSFLRAEVQNYLAQQNPICAGSVV